MPTIEDVLDLINKLTPKEQENLKSMLLKPTSINKSTQVLKVL